MIGVATIISVVESQRLIGHRVPIVPRARNGSAHMGELSIREHAFQIPEVIVLPGCSKRVVKVF